VSRLADEKMNGNKLAIVIKPLDSTGHNSVLQRGLANQIRLPIASERLFDMDNTHLSIRADARGHADAGIRAQGRDARKEQNDEYSHGAWSGLTKKAEPPPTRDVNRDSGTDSANGGWLQRLVRRMIHVQSDKTLLLSLVVDSQM
jgi:hypothetical protein